VSLRFVSYNIRYGGTGREAQIASVIQACAPDVVVLQEATDPDVVARVAEQSGFAHWGSRPGYSTGFLSRLPVTHHAWHSPVGAKHPFLEVVLEGGHPRIFGLHLSAWFSNWSERRRAREIRLLLDGIREHQNGFHIIAGDFNALAPGERFDSTPMPAWIRGMVWLSGRDIARSTIEMMRADGYADAWRTVHPDAEREPGYTFPVWNPHVRLDYVFTPAIYAPRVRACEVRREPDVVRTASDHFPLLVELADS
jgi:endonuclease/exonuclease/phosphatase family metal-dependent hydrolase